MDKYVGPILTRAIMRSLGSSSRLKSSASDFLASFFVALGFLGFLGFSVLVLGAAFGCRENTNLHETFSNNNQIGAKEVL